MLDFRQLRRLVDLPNALMFGLYYVDNLLFVDSSIKVHLNFQIKSTGFLIFFFFFKYIFTCLSFDFEQKDRDK